MKKIILLLFIVASYVTHAQIGSPWKRLNKNDMEVMDRNANKSISTAQLRYQLDVIALKKSLSPLEDKTLASNNIEIAIPNMNGVLEKFKVQESSNF